ncbi:CDP-alcohol phosphatidyltransferase family protein [Streptomyces sp. NPDC001904]|uniref:CDP-alcohol phosphatidyltransferase family protein n=1 Tax=Streptomyces sp. NPDC001904 TaxID=3154531 RepID=UPI00331D7CD1
MRKLSVRAVQKLTCKKRDAWWTVLLVDPVATRMLCWLARFRFVTPNRVTWAALFVGLGSAGLFLRGDRMSLIIGAALYHLSFILDCIDGKLARLKGNGSVFGGWLDYVFDRIRVLFCALALMGGQYLRTHEAYFLLAALVVVFLDMLRYVDALQIYKMRMSMRTKIEKVTAERKAAEAQAAAEAAAEQAARAEQFEQTQRLLRAREAQQEPQAGHRPPQGRPAPQQAQPAAGAESKVVFMEDLLRENPGIEADVLKQHAGTGEVVDLHAQFRGRFPWYTRVRQALLRSRIRPHLISGIEFQMFIFIVGPLIGQILWTTAASAVLLGLFELVIMYKFWLSTRDFTRVMDELAPAPQTVGTVADHLFAGRHRGRVPDAPLPPADVEERFPAPQPYEDPGFHPYPQPEPVPYQQPQPGYTYVSPLGSYVPADHQATQPIPVQVVQRVEQSWTEGDGRLR